MIEDVDGNRFLDLAAGICVNALGHSHPRYREIVKAQIDEVIVGSFTSPYTMRFRSHSASATIAITSAPDAAHSRWIEPSINRFPNPTSATARLPFTADVRS